MEHSGIRQLMSRWYAMWGNQLNVTCEGDQKESSSGTGSDTCYQMEERKEEAEGKDEAVALPSVLRLPLQRQTASSEQHDGSDGQDLTKVVSQ